METPFASLFDTVYAYLKTKQKKLHLFDRPVCNEACSFVVYHIAKKNKSDLIIYIFLFKKNQQFCSGKITLIRSKVRTS